jgi:hypothetical protein
MTDIEPHWNNKVFPYLLTKLSAAGFMFSIMAIYVLLAVHFDMYEFSETFQVGIVSLILGYSITCSILIDLMKRSFYFDGVFLEVLLYLIAGFLPFVFIMGFPYYVIAGFVGGLCSIFFLFGHHFIKINGIKLLFAFVLPVLLVVTNLDFTTKQNWQEVRNDSSYTATFDYFNGEHEIPITANAGEIIFFSINFINKNNGGYGYHVKNDENDHMPMEEVSEFKHVIQINENGLYRIVITGDNFQGKVEVDWDIK